ncbi:GLPGLI family protein [Sediminibacterium sp.]|uniref:GLPGLI family protein n=1 Tax=Sediminibacterium sp. TaxID=1917865 RepID=UPI0027361216|nr:GLPGLI family protein [Sediminibacterium sp.]MDP3393987.1 GLPGLI family protein [Sediminibacterium sp.]MDP3566762.1 GLPGLI family protein [Sediminibacterium sp.]
MKKTIFSFTILLFSSFLNAQVQFIQSGRIEFEKRVNQHAPILDEGENMWNVEILKQIPKFVSDVYELKFTTDKSVYKLAKENPNNKYMWGTKPIDTDVSMQDFKKGISISQKEVFENTYLIKDSSRSWEWKIADETREIAGFECRKAVTKICDSVYVVAFYTDQIPVSAGPESFGGLPGMILGLAVPRLNTTWFATKLELAAPTVNELNVKQKGKQVGRAQLTTELSKALKDWGKEGARKMWVAQL